MFRTAAIFALVLATGGAAAQETPEGTEVIRSHGISVFGDLKYGPDFEHFDYVEPEAPKGGTWSGRGTAANNTFDSLNPFILKGDSAQGLGLTFESLLTGSADEADAAYGLVAHTVVYPEDRSWVIFEMRPEATFADGSPITADDVVFSLEILREEGHPAYRQNFKDIVSAEALGPHEVKFTFTNGVSTRDLPLVAGGISILSKDWWGDREFGDSSLDPILGSGPYKVGEVKPGRSIVYERRPDYWGWDLPVNRGTANFDRIVFEYFKDYTAAFEAFKGGAFLFHEEFFSKIWATGYEFPAIDKGWVIKENIPDGRPSGTQGFWINMRRDKFQDPRVREALGLAFDFEWSNEKLFYGLYTRTDSFWENSPMEADGPPSPEELAILRPFADQLPAGVLEEPAYAPPVSDGSGADRRLLRRASNLLNEAGWEVGPDGLRRKDGRVLTLEILDDSPTFGRIIEPYVSNLKRIGVEASYRVVDPAQYQARSKEYDYDMVPGRLVMSLTPGLELRRIFGSEAADLPDSPNYSGVKSDVVDALIEKVVDAETREEVTVAVRALDRVLRAMHIWVPNWFKASYNIAYWDVYSRPDIQPLYARGDMGTWWWDEEKAAKLRAEGAL